MRGVTMALAVGFMVAPLAPAARAGIDYGCLAACQQAGYPHQACRTHCTVATPNQSTPSPLSPRHGTDYRCVDKCTGTGRHRDYCLRHCSY